VRKLPAKNFLAFARCWDRVLVVATGAGIGPVVSFLGSVERNRGTEKLVKVLWCARNPFSAEWEDVRRAIDRVDSTPWILESKSNSKYSGRSGSRNRRPDLLEESKAVAREYGIQACFVVGNKTVTDMIVGGLKRVGVPAYGAVFDS
jgi:ferredoxin-NADP reductase